MADRPATESPPPGGWKTPGDPSIDGTDFPAAQPREEPATKRACAHGIAVNCEQCWWIRIHEHRFDLFAPDDAVCTASECTVTRGRAIEAEAAAHATERPDPQGGPDGTTR